MKRQNMEPIGVNHLAPDLVAIARGFGCMAFHAATLDQFRVAIEASKNADTPTIIQLNEAETLAWTTEKMSAAQV